MDEAHESAQIAPHHLPVQHGVPRLLGIVVRRLRFGVLDEVIAGAEALAGPRQRDHVHARIEIGLLRAGGELARRGQRDRVAALGPIEGEPSDSVRHLVSKRRRFHEALLRWSGSCILPSPVRTCVRTMIVCVLYPRFELLAALGDRGALLAEPAALAPEAGREQVVGEVSAPAEAYGVVPGMRLGEAMARCPALRLVPPDPEGVRSLWHVVLDRLEGIGAEVESDHAGAAFFAAEGLQGLHGGSLPGVVGAAREALGPGARLGMASSRFASHAAALQVRPRRGRHSYVVVEAAVRDFLAPLPVGLLRTRLELQALPEVLERL